MSIIASIGIGNMGSAQVSNITCIGIGNMGCALMSAALRVIPGENIFITDSDNEKARNTALSLGAKVLSSNIEAAETGDFLFLAVKPQVLQQVLVEIAPAVNKRLQKGNTKENPPVLVSMAAGWSIGKIQNVISGESSGQERVPVVRIMPNTPVMIAQGVIAMSASPEVPPCKLEELEKLLGTAGITDRIDEHYMDAVTALSGSGPAFVYLFIEALADGAARAGFPKEKALLYAAQTVKGAALMVQETGKDPGELKDMVTSPGGTTIAGIAALEDGAFRSTVMNAVEAAWKRSKELG